MCMLIPLFLFIDKIFTYIVTCCVIKEQAGNIRLIILYELSMNFCGSKNSI